MHAQSSRRRQQHCSTNQAEPHQHTRAAWHTNLHAKPPMAMPRSPASTPVELMYAMTSEDRGGCHEFK